MAGPRISGGTPKLRTERGGVVSKNVRAIVVARVYFRKSLFGSTEPIAPVGVFFFFWRGGDFYFVNFLEVPSELADRFFDRHFGLRGGSAGISRSRNPLIIPKF